MKCKVGDIAVITMNIQNNVGRLVLIYEYYGEVDYPHMDLWKMPSWSVESMGGALKTSTGQLAYDGHIPDFALHPIGGTTITRRDLEQARADAELEAAWENLREVSREMGRQAALPVEEMAEADVARSDELNGRLL